MNYGMPYKGSKNKIAERIISKLPRAEYFVDLFGGGGAITHCALLSGKYKHVIYNDFDTLVAKGFKMAVNGEFKDEKRWISREDFFELKDVDPYVALCFSFGNDARTYAYSRNMERYKKAMHELFFEGQTKSILEYPFVDKESIEQLCKIEGRKERRLAYRSIVLKNAVSDGKCVKKKGHWYADGKNIERLQSLESLESLERLERLERLQSLESLENLRRLEIYNLSYEQIKIPDNSVIYCDIPYKNTEGYRSGFDHDKFYEWARKLGRTVYISEYSMPDDFSIVGKWDKRCSLSISKTTKTVERLFCNHAIV